MRNLEQQNNADTKAAICRGDRGGWILFGQNWSALSRIAKFEGTELMML